MSTLLEQWRETAYSREMTKDQLEKFWGAYFQIEKGIYEKMHTFVREGKKIGRNDPCPCGSGKKYKHCCGKN